MERHSVDEVIHVANGDGMYKSFNGNGKQYNREKCMRFFLILCVLVIIGLIVAVIILATRNDEDTAEVCLNSDCVHTAVRVIDNMDASVDPCEDFYTYSCGGWERKNVLPEDKSGQNVFSLLYEDVKVINKYLLEDEDSYKDVEGIQKAKDLYAACIDTDRIAKLNNSVCVPLLEEFGGWPVLGSNPGGNWNESDFSLVQLLIKIKRYNNNPLIQMYVRSDVKDTEHRILYIDQPSFGMPGPVYYKDPSLERMRNAYVKLASSVAVLFGAEQTSAEKAMREVLELEKEIANITVPQEERRDNEALYNKMTISELAQNFTEPGPSDNIQFNWFEYVNGTMDLDDVKVPINESEYVVVRSVPYFQKLLPVLQKYDKRIIANYVIWYIMKNRANNLDSRFTDLLTDYKKVLYGTTSAVPRWKTCLSYVVSTMGMAVGHMFVKETFDESARTVALEMIANIRESFTELLDENDWMDSETKKSALEKLEAMRSWIGYPSDILEPETINKLFENYTIDREEHFNNVLNNLKLSSSSGLQVLRQKYDKNVWSTPPSTVNAYYSMVLNNIMFPAGILQPPFYSKYQPRSMNYGAIGVIIGHEITHGFDDRGRQYDKDGNLEHWWKPEIIENFKEKAQCIVDQYGRYVVPKVNISVNGINTQGENIADNGGLKQSFRAYRKWVEKRGSEEPTLPGLNFTNNQLFFISFGQLWCNTMREEALINSINNGVHSPGQFRVVGTLQNSKDFAEAFGCNNNQYMNPPDKCEIW